MAHQAHTLPWQTLADNFKFVPTHARYHDYTNLYPCFKPGQGKEIHHFARVFTQVMGNFVTTERNKYKKEYSPLEDDDIFIPESSAKRIAQIVKRYKEPRFGILGVEKPLILKDEERKVPFWLKNIRDDSSYPSDSVRECTELLKTLLLFGEMEPLFRLAAHPQVNLATIWSYPYDSWAECGWKELKNCALMAYLCLNVLHLKPEIYDPTCRARFKKTNQTHMREEDMDYRLTKSYQKMLISCTYTRGYDNYEVCAYPHREFFGILRNMIQSPWRYKTCGIYPGICSVDDILDKHHRSCYVPTNSDIPNVQHILRQKGLPTELALQILADADYTPARRIPVPNDPLHPSNGEELKKYLSYCWKVLVRVDMLLQANGRCIDWEAEVLDCIYKLWGVPYPKMHVLRNKVGLEEELCMEGDIENSRVKLEFL